MERLTEYLGGIPHIKRTINGINSKANYLRDFDIEAVKKLAAYEDTGLTTEEIEYNKKALELFAARPGGDRVLEIAKAEQEGRLVVLPCKLGDTIYILRGDVKNGYETVKKTHVEEVQFRLGCLDKQMKLYPFYYLTRAEAEAALKGVSEDA